MIGNIQHAFRAITVIYMHDLKFGYPFDNDMNMNVGVNCSWHIVYLFGREVV